MRLVAEVLTKGLFAADGGAVHGPLAALAAAHGAADTGANRVVHCRPCVRPNRERELLSVLSIKVPTGFFTAAPLLDVFTAAGPTASGSCWML